MVNGMESSSEKNIIQIENVAAKKRYLIFRKSD